MGMPSPAATSIPHAVVGSSNGAAVQPEEQPEASAVAAASRLATALPGLTELGLRVKDRQLVSPHVLS